MKPIPLIPLLALLLLPTLAHASDDYFPPSDKDGGWRTPGDATKTRTLTGMDVPKLDYAFDYCTRTSPHGGLLVARHGYLVYERYYGRGNREAIPTMASVGKAFTSAACGVMLQEFHDKIPQGLDTKVFTEQYLPEALPLDEPRKADITLGQLLSMAAGLHGEGGNPGFVNFEPSVKLDPIPRHPTEGIDLDALHTPLWCNPGGGYSYASTSPHVASIVLRHVTGMEMQDYIDARLAKPMGWGPWGYGVHNRDGSTLPHVPGGGNIALRSTDALRFCYLLLHHGKWADKQLIPSDYVEACGKPSPYQKHAPFSLMFEINADGHVAGAPRDAYFKSGAGGFGVAVVPSLDLVLYRMAGDDRQYDPAATGLKQDYPYDGSRDHWKPATRSQFSDGPIGTDDALRRTLEMVVAAVVQ